jgi:hypothetical protein
MIRLFFIVKAKIAEHNGLVGVSGSKIWEAES